MLRPSQKLFLGNNCSVVRVHQNKINSRKLGSNCKVFLLFGAPNSNLSKLSQTHGSHLSLCRKASKSVPGPLESRGLYSEAVSGILEAMSEGGTRQPPPFPHVQEAGPKKLCAHTCELSKSQSCHHYVTQNKTIHSFRGRDALKLPRHMCVGSSASAAAGGSPGKAKCPRGGKTAACGCRPAAHWSLSHRLLISGLSGCLLPHGAHTFLSLERLGSPMDAAVPLVSLKAPRQPPPQSPRVPSVTEGSLSPGSGRRADGLVRPSSSSVCFWPS